MNVFWQTCYGDHAADVLKHQLESAADDIGANRDGNNDKGIQVKQNNKFGCRNSKLMKSLGYTYF